MHTYVQYVYVFVYIVHTYEAREGEQFLFIFPAHPLQIVYNFPIIVHLILFECL